MAKRIGIPLIALVIAVGAGAVVLVPSLGLLFTLYLRGHLDTPEHPSSVEPAPVVLDTTHANDGSGPNGRTRAWGAAAVVGLVGGSGLVVLANADWVQMLGVLLLVLCAVSVFALAAPSPGRE